MYKTTVKIIAISLALMTLQSRDSVGKCVENTKIENNFIKIENNVEKIDTVENIDINQEKFEFIKKRFEIFNSNISDSTINTVILVMGHFDLDSTDERLDIFTHQILLESGAKQFYPNSNKVITSSAGALGFTQIMPNTAFSFLKRIVDSTEMSNLGSTDFSWIHSSKGMYSAPESEIRLKVKEWLSIEKNNIILWGNIMDYGLKKRNGHIYHALIAYNSGPKNLNSFLQKGGHYNNHRYIRGIRSKMSKTKYELNKETL